MPTLEDITYSDDEEDVGAEADFSNLETTITISPIPTTRVHKDHPVTQIIGDLSLAPQTRSMTRMVKEQGGASLIQDAKGLDSSRFAKGKRAIGSKWVSRNKKDERGIVIRNKARLVTQMDVKSAFLYGTIEEEVYVCQPPGFEDPDYPDKGKIDQTLFIKKQKGDILLVQVYVDDIIFGSTNKDLCKAFEKLMKDKFQMSSMGELTFFLGLQVKQKKDGIFISQDKYVAEILKKFGLIDGKSVSTPIDTDKPLLKDPIGEDVDILDFLNASVIKYALTVNPTIYVSCIKQFWSSVSIKKTNDVVRLQALIDRRKVIITEDTVRQALRLDDAESIDCLPNEEIFAELERMGLVRNVDSFSKFYMYPRFLQLMIDAQVGDLSSHTTKYTSLALTQKVFANMRRVGKGFYRVDTLLFEGMLVPQQVNDDVADDVVTNDVANQVADVVAEDAAEPAPPSPTLAITPPPPQQEVTSTPPPSPHQSSIAPPSSPQQQQQASPPSQPTGISMELLNTLLETCTTLTKKVEALEQDKIAQALEITKLKQRVRRLEKNKKLKVLGLKRLKKLKLDADEDVTLEEVDAEKDAKVAKKDADAQWRQEESQSQVYHIDLKHADKVLSMHDDEAKPAEVKEVIEVVTTAKLMTEVVTAATTPITAAHSAARRRKGVVIRDPEETATPFIIVHSEPKSKDKGKGILVEEPKPLKKQAQIEKDEAHARELEAELNKNINWNDVIEQPFNSIVGFLEKSEKELKEEASKALKRISESSEQQAVKKQKLNEEVEELKTHLQIVPNDEDDVYIESTPLALKVPIVDYQIHTENNKPHYKIIRADGTHQLFLSFISLLKNFDREDLEMLCFGVDVVEDFKEYTLRDYYCWLKTYCCWYKLKLLDNAADSRLRLLEESAAADDKMKK
uniref:Reverse transcriptase Ty1/copia-type domain-containing protein n=1 Tax=Tanacetum cinerariifolium TaxID=118510 RepID=A0A699H5Z5_TANCI|nr:hypothetical protein [Tanacetum cinerariifolium]